MILDAKTIDVSRIKLFSNDSDDSLGEDRDKSLRRNGRNSSKVYKLCICLAEGFFNKSKRGKNLSKMGHLQNKELLREPNQQQTSDANEYNGSNSTNEKSNKMGLVFAVKPNLQCSEFSSYVCKVSS